ncbi:sodium/glutamate symporter [Steroidobacter agaridevorans]|uniref:Sodium/glutamate symporter n=1 Tax=Steroidobacter agaridevorans TaxID=2695856 RepID=A0A829YIX5_9GAMM|nr:sodium/glutamate symporter [Steroidobacter agaridevorans]GFE83237.1 sodium/glutamate symporter [Steroidobacter agaridevorans]
MTFGLVETLASCACLLFFGYFLQRTIPGLARLNIPAPVLGGLLAALAIVVARANDWPVATFDTTLQRPLLVAFFTTLGFSASLALLRAGGTQVVVLLALVTGFAIVQNLVGIALALSFGLPPALGVLTGSVTLTGGPATGLAFAPLFEAAGIESAATVAVATAMGGIVLGGLVGGPIGSLLIARHRLRGAEPNAAAKSPTQLSTDLPASEAEPLGEDSLQVHTALKTVAAVLVAMWAGTAISAGITSLGVTLPEYIGAMLAAAILRNIDDRTRWLKLSHTALDLLGAVALSFFLVMALMTLDLTKLASMAGPLIAMLLVQVVLVAMFSLWPVFPLMGRDYDAAVTSGGFLGFMLGTTANAMAVMRTLVERFGAAPRAFLVAPLVGAFFLDFTNALVITAFLNFLK